jgi:hypothetical protein
MLMLVRIARNVQLMIDDCFDYSGDRFPIRRHLNPEIQTLNNLAPLAPLLGLMGNNSPLCQTLTPI